MARAELVFFQVDIVGHGQLNVPDAVLHSARRLVEQYALGLCSVSTHLVRDSTGRAVFWAGDGGWLAFDARDAAAFGDATNAAVDLLAVLPRINERLVADVGQPIRLRLSLDAMNVELGGSVAQDLSHLASPHLNAFLKRERLLGFVNHVVITNRIERQLSDRRLRGRFDRWRSLQIEHLGETILFALDARVRRDEQLMQLRNQGNEADGVPPQDLSVETFPGESYQSLARLAYGDLTLAAEPSHVSTWQFLAYRNALALQALEWLELRQDVRSSLAGPTAAECDRRARVAFAPYDNINRERWPDLAQSAVSRVLELHYVGGEGVTFFNADALGFRTIIGNGTLLSGVVSGCLKLHSVIGGVSPPDAREEDWLGPDGSAAGPEGVGQ